MSCCIERSGVSRIRDFFAKKKRNFQGYVAVAWLGGFEKKLIDLQRADLRLECGGGNTE